MAEILSSQNIGKANAIANRQLAKNMGLRPIRSESQPKIRIATRARIAESTMALRITLRAIHSQIPFPANSNQ
jgi:hypothetical protein